MIYKFIVKNPTNNKYEIISLKANNMLEAKDIVNTIFKNFYIINIGKGE